jgi:nicotinate-nucleotide--dimethylbenzimidazole phosphoribosyltransferase
MNLLERTIAEIKPQSQEYRKAARERLEQLTMPLWALGRLMDLAVDLAGMTASLKPSLEKKMIVIMASDHGVVSEGVSKYPQEVTCQMVRNFIGGGAGINAISRTVSSIVSVVDIGVAGDIGDLTSSGEVISRRIGNGTNNIAVGPAMTRGQAVDSLETGISLALEMSPDADIFGTGEMGIGNTTPSSAITAAITLRSVEDVTGRGTGLEPTELSHKVAVIKRALSVNRPIRSDPLDILAKVGGFEIGGLAGLILGAASVRKPVIIDGFISTAAALLAHGLCLTSSEYMIASHRSVEPGHQYALGYLGKAPLLDLDLRLGEGTGAALAMPLVEAAIRVLTEVATFAEAAVATAKT